MCYEVLFGKGKIKGGGAVKREVNKYIASLTEGLAALMLERGAAEKVDLLPERVAAMARMPTYIRVNNLKLSAQKGLDIVQAMCADARLDEVIPGLIYIPAGTPSFGQNAHVKNGELIIQDKASCIPSQTLADHWEGGDVLDACAAPGNKTSHVASILLRQEGMPTPTIVAFDRSKTRSELLRRRLDEAGAQAVRVKNEDFLLADVHAPEYAGVRSVLCDPSCSGSGLIRSLDRLGDDDKEDYDERLDSLQRLQLSIVKKAMTFPAVRNVVYSTCSVHTMENEDVVAQVLQDCPGWGLEPPRSMSGWERRGEPHALLTAQQSLALIRCLPSDGLNGFFVSNFVRKPAVSANPPSHVADMDTDTGTGTGTIPARGAMEAGQTLDTSTSIDSDRSVTSDQPHPSQGSIQSSSQSKETYMWHPLSSIKYLSG